MLVIYFSPPCWIHLQHVNQRLALAFRLIAVELLTIKYRRLIYTPSVQEVRADKHVTLSGWPPIAQRFLALDFLTFFRQDGILFGVKSSDFVPKNDNSKNAMFA